MDIDSELLQSCEEDFVESGEWAKPGSNPYAQQAHKMAEQIKEKALTDVDEIWGTEVNLFILRLLNRLID